MKIILMLVIMALLFGLNPKAGVTSIIGLVLYYVLMAILPTWLGTILFFVLIALTLKSWVS